MSSELDAHEWRIVDREQIREVKARYFRYVDTKQWENLLSLFTDDARFNGTSVPDPDRHTFVQWLSGHFADVVSVHHGGSAEIVFLAPDLARGVWAMSDRVEFLNPRPVVAGSRAGAYGFTGAGHYEEEYRREGNVWKISSWRLTRLRVDLLDAPTSPVLPPQSGLLRSAATSWLNGE